MMTIKPKEGFKLKQQLEDSRFKGLELVVQNNGPNTITVEVVEDTIVIKVKHDNKIFN